MAIPPVPISPNPNWGQPPKELRPLLEHAIKDGQSSTLPHGKSLCNRRAIAL